MLCCASPLGQRCLLHQLLCRTPTPVHVMANRLLSMVSLPPAALHLGVLLLANSQIIMWLQQEPIVQGRRKKCILNNQKAK